MGNHFGFEKSIDEKVKETFKKSIDKKYLKPIR